MTRPSKKQERLNRIEQLITALKDCSDSGEILKLGQIEHDWLFSNYKASSAGTFISSEYLPAIDTAFPTSEGAELEPTECWQKVNGVLVKRHLVVQTLKPTIEEWDERNKPVKESTVDRINSKLPLYPQPILARATELLEANSWAKVAAGLIALTGRRPTEIAWSARFDCHTEYSLIFSGQLKKGIVEADSKSIPTLIEANRVLVAFHRLRNLQSDRTNILQIDTVTEATKASNSQINRAVYQNFSNLLDAPTDKRGLQKRENQEVFNDKSCLVPNHTNKSRLPDFLPSSRKFSYLSASNLRAAYGRIAAYFYCPPEYEPILYVGQILGHKTDNYDLANLGTTIHYYTYRIVDKEGQNRGDLGIYHHRLTTSDFVTNSLTTETNFVTNSPTMNQSDIVTPKPGQPHVTDLKNALSGTQLADRFDVSRPTIGRNRKKGTEHFAAWSQNSDPDRIAWQFFGEGKLESTGHHRQVDIYLPLDPNDSLLSQLTADGRDDETKSALDPIQQPNHSPKRAKPASTLQLQSDQIDRLNAIARSLGLRGNSTQQFDQLLDRVESGLNGNQFQDNQPSTNEQLITQAIETIATFSENLNNTLTPLTTELKNLIKSQNELKSIQDLSPETELPTEHDNGRISETELNPELATSAGAAGKQDRAETTAVETSSNTTISPTIDRHTRESTIDALNTAIALKRSAISKEKKKRSKSNLDTIRLWQAEIERLESSIDFLSQLEPD